MPAADRVYNVLFLCTGNSARSILGEAVLNHVGNGRFKAFSAGSLPKGKVHPITLETLKEAGIPTDGLRSKAWDEFAVAGAPKMDFVFTVCDNAAGEACPVWPGQPMTAHWGIEDPAAHGAGVQAAPSVRRRAAIHAQPHRGLHQPSAREHRQYGSRFQAAWHRRHGRLDHKGIRGRMTLVRRLAAETLGTALLVATVVGSGIMANRLTNDTAMALMGNAIPTGSILFILITVFGPISGAHFNPAVTAVFAARREINWQSAALYVAAQIAGGIVGSILAHLMFDLSALRLPVSGQVRRSGCRKP